VDANRSRIIMAEDVRLEDTAFFSSDVLEVGLANFRKNGHLTEIIILPF